MPSARRRFAPAPDAMTSARSRHDHFPRADAARRVAMRRAVGELEAGWKAADTAPDGLLAAIDALAGAPADMAIERLLPWLTDTLWLRGRLGAALALMQRDPFARPPLRPVGGGGYGPGGLILADRGAIRLTLQLWPFAANAPAPTSTLFVPGRAAVHVLAHGGARLCAHRVAVGAAEEAGGFTASAAPPCHSAPPRPLRKGETLLLDTARQSFSLNGASGDVLLLELTVQPPSRLPIRAYDIASGHLLHVSASRRDSSFRAMALALLRHLGRTDAVPLFVAETQSEDFAARWTAMRELVALDSAAACPLLKAMAVADPHPEVRRAAAATYALIFPPSGETGREGGGGPGSRTSTAPSTPNSAPHDRDPAACPA